MDLNFKDTIFVHIPKTAGESIKRWLSDNSINFNSDPELLHKSLDEIKNFYVEKDGKINYRFSFTVVRNTYDRMISLYEWTKYKRTRKFFKDIKRGNPPNPTDKKLIEVLEKGIVYFLNFLKDNPFDNYTLRSQVDWIKDVDIILRTENITEEFGIIQNKLNCHSPLTQKLHVLDYDPSIYYSDNFLKFVETNFQDELDYFKYLPKH